MTSYVLGWSSCQLGSYHRPPKVVIWPDLASLSLKQPTAPTAASKPRTCPFPNVSRPQVERHHKHQRTLSPRVTKRREIFDGMLKPFLLPSSLGGEVVPPFLRARSSQNRENTALPRRPRAFHPTARSETGFRPHLRANRKT